MKIIVVGGGVFGLGAALELRGRGHEVALFDRCELPAPDASSNDISRIIRMDYGDDEFYTELCHEAIRRWRKWNNEAAAEKAGKLFHEVGIVVMSKEKIDGGGFEKDSFLTVQRQGVNLERLSAEQGNPISARFKGWNRTKEYVDGYFNPVAGWGDAAETVSFMARRARKAGVIIRTGAQGEISRLLESGKKVVGIQTKDGQEHRGDVVLVASGAWSPSIVKELEGLVTAVAHPVVYVQVPPTLRRVYEGQAFPVFTADIARTGFYGFPLGPNHDLFKIGNHGKGYVTKKVLADGRYFPVPDATYLPPKSEQERLTSFVQDTFPDLKTAQMARCKLCWYCESWDSNFYIDHVPGREGLVVACGSTGHGFKFAPVIGEIIADAVEKKPNKTAERFRWRVKSPADERKLEACRFVDGDPIVLTPTEPSKL